MTTFAHLNVEFKTKSAQWKPHTLIFFFVYCVYTLPHLHAIQSFDLVLPFDYRKCRSNRNHSNHFSNVERSSFFFPSPDFQSEKKRKKVERTLILISQKLMGHDEIKIIAGNKRNKNENKKKEFLPWKLICCLFVHCSFMTIGDLFRLLFKPASVFAMFIFRHLPANIRALTQIRK